MMQEIIAVVGGIALLIWSADRFIDGASATATHLGMPPLLVGMVIVGFGTSAPELVVSVFAALQGNPGVALGNAYGSNIANIALILGLTAVISPIIVQSHILRKELPLLTAVWALAAYQVYDGAISRADAIVLLLLFVALMAWSIRAGLNKAPDTFGAEVDVGLKARAMPMGKALMWLAVGLILLVVSSRLLVWGAVEIARAAGVSDIVVGLTVVAIGTSLPELASAIIATRKGEHEIALGNVIGSNLFNTLAVVGLAGVIQPMTFGQEVFYRDIAVMGVLTLSLFIFGYGFRGSPGRINRVEGSVLVLAFAAYTGYLVHLAIAGLT